MFEKNLIETYIKENGVDPINNEELSEDDLIAVNTTNDPVVRSRPPTLTSIPALLSAFQNEWDALALETFTLRQQLKQTRQELSTALYHHDAAVRVAARLTKERDEARESLAQLAASIGTGAPIPETATNGTSAAPEPQTTEAAAAATAAAPSEEDTANALAEEVVSEILAKRQELASTRKKRKPPAGWATADQIQSFSASPADASKQLFTTVSSLTSDPTGQLMLTGGGKSQAGVYSKEAKAVVASLSASGIVTGTAWTASNKLVLGTKNGFVDVFSYDEAAQTAAKSGEVVSLKEQGRIVAVAAHPVESLAVAISTVPVSKAHPEPQSSLSLVRVGGEENEVLLTVPSAPGTVYTSLSLHPDGALVAVGTAHGTIQLHELTTGGKVAATFDVNETNPDAGEVTALAFSENGYWLVSGASKVAASAQLWDLRKKNPPVAISFPSAAVAGNETAVVKALAFDYTGQFLAAVTENGTLDVVGYTKASKSWTQESLFSSSEVAQPVTGSVQWGALGLDLSTVSARGVVQTFGPEAQDVDMKE